MPCLSIDCYALITNNNQISCIKNDPNLIFFLNLHQWRGSDFESIYIIYDLTKIYLQEAWSPLALCFQLQI